MHCKIPYLDSMAAETPTIIALSETHLTPSVMDSEIKIKGHNSHITDREGHTHGRVIIYVPESIPSKTLLSHSNSACDSIVIEVTINNQTMNMVNVYFPPGSTPQEMIDSLEKTSACSQIADHTREIIIMGDLNLPHST